VAHTAPFRPLSIAVLTVSDTRTLDTDTSGATLVRRLEEAGHTLADRRIVPDVVTQVRDTVRAWCDRPRGSAADPAAPPIDVVLTTGGTGITGRDVTPEAVEPLFEKHLPGFGELFRWLSYADIGAACVQSRATAGVRGETFVFALPGSRGAVTLAWDKILAPQLDARTPPCSFATLLPRLAE